MKLSLIICTYKRSESLLRLLESVKQQSHLPDEILVIDASPDKETALALKNTHLAQLRYHKVEPEQRGLTKQRNTGIELCNPNTDIVSFLDDDTVLKPEYFKNLIKVFKDHPQITGVGGIAVNENQWQKTIIDEKDRNHIFKDGYRVKLSTRYKLRQKLGLMSDLAPGQMPKFSHGNTQSYPLTGKTYQVDLLLGMSMAYRSKVVFNQKFSEYFEGYGLYEDADYSIRALKFGQNVIASSVQLEHHHHASGRPNQFTYGKMVVRNGWYVWRLRWPEPGFKNVVKWHANVLLLAFLRLGNTITTRKKKQAFTEALGRFTALFLLCFKKPDINR
ncbi:glycosyltransferase family 2 protein [Psychroflexus sp. YR1-1]|uniref:Glycosyltransferase family 2 protein n=1 Tax=Psychroflexus aurantiacus TaxID=2709310 RepID=A0A6B3R1L3_9FLAO|nr:glycosyltransferase family A protein [Psychroflexus aurantiacus]NEV93928.1 glycosyltransferase family 2 protein [Psychroflexus aurantiacus]